MTPVRERPGIVTAVLRNGHLRRIVQPRTWRRFIAVLRGRRRTSACRAVLDGAFVALTLRRRGLRPLLRDWSSSPPVAPAEARQIAEVVDTALELLPLSPTCLRRSVTLLRELHRHDRGAELHIGVRPGPQGIEAHAWVQVGNEVVNDDPEVVRTYVPLSVGDAERLSPRFV